MGLIETMSDIHRDIGPPTSPIEAQMIHAVYLVDHAGYEQGPNPDPRGVSKLYEMFKLGLPGTANTFR